MRAGFSGLVFVLAATVGADVGDVQTRHDNDATTYEVIVDAVSGDVGSTAVPLTLQRLAPNGGRVLSTAGIAALAGQSGAVTVTSDAPFGALAAKVVALEAATGFSFDSSMMPQATPANAASACCPHECPPLSCAGWYHGWVGDTCYGRADTLTTRVDCCGGVCADRDDACASTGQGAATLTCDSFCQNPRTGTCTGTSPGLCDNVDQGNATCGSGPCQVSPPRCISGVPNACVPNSGAASPEVCDDIDNNCDGAVDNGNFADAFEPNNVCGDVRSLATVYSLSQTTRTYSALTLYPAGDEDLFRINAEEDDSSCSFCGGTLTDEDYRLTIQLTVPTGAGSYRFCTSMACAVNESCKTVAAGTSATWLWDLDGSCVGDDAYSIYVRIAGVGAPGYECRPYTLSYSLQRGCFN